MARPKKKININMILALYRQGLSLRKITQVYNSLEQIKLSKNIVRNCLKTQKTQNSNLTPPILPLFNSKLSRNSKVSKNCPETQNCPETPPTVDKSCQKSQNLSVDEISKLSRNSRNVDLITTVNQNLINNINQDKNFKIEDNHVVGNKIIEENIIDEKHVVGKNKNKKNNEVGNKNIEENIIDEKHVVDSKITDENVIGDKHEVGNKIIEENIEENNDGFYSMHHIGYIVKYEGEIKNEGIQFKAGNKKNQYLARRIKTDKVVFDVRGKTITVWIMKSAIENKTEDNPERLQEMAKQLVLQELFKLAKRHHLRIFVETLKQISEPHLNIKNKQINSVLNEMSSEERAALMNSGIVVGDRSHPDEVEFTKNTINRGKILIWLIDEFPEQIKILFDINAQLITHLKENIETQNRYIKMNEERFVEIAKNIEYIKHKLE